MSWRISLRELLQNIGGNSSIYLSEMEGDLLQMNMLLVEAIGKLGSNVIEIGQRVQRQQEILKQLAESENSSSSVVEELNALNRKMDINVASVITAMQFQDMTSQLLDRVLSRVAGLQEILEEVSSLASDVSSAESEGDIQMMVHATGEAMTQYRYELEEQHARRVSQKHMESGSIELF